MLSIVIFIIVSIIVLLIMPVLFPTIIGALSLWISTKPDRMAKEEWKDAVSKIEGSLNNIMNDGIIISENDDKRQEFSSIVNTYKINNINQIIRLCEKRESLIDNKFIVEILSSIDQNENWQSKFINKKIEKYLKN